MMKKVMTLFLILVVFSFNNVLLKADCASDKNDVEMVYYETAPLYEDGKVDTYILIYGLTKGMSVEFYNNVENKTVKYSAEELLDGYKEAELIIPNSENTDISFSVNIYSDSCGNEVVKTFGETLPEVNKYAYSDFCKAEGFKSDYCGIYADTKDMSEEEVRKKVEKEIKNYNFQVRITNGVKNYYLFVLIPVLIVIAIFVVKIYLLKKKQKEKLK